MSARARFVIPEPSHLRPEMTVLSDLSANIFAALLLILVILLPLDRRAGGQPARVEATTDLGAVAHRPLRPRELVDLLAQRAPGTPGLSVDLGERTIGLPSDDPDEIAGPAAPGAQEPGRIDGLLGALRADQPVRLYVFSNHRYGEVVARLRRAGLSWQEISVPRALRDPSGDFWSRAFLEVVARQDKAGFREGLAHLLAGTDQPLVANGGTAGGGAWSQEVSAGSPAGLSLLDRLARWLRIALALGAVAVGLGVVAVTEILVPRRALDYGLRNPPPAGSR